jgi:acyl-CoA thioester hydrolase
VRVVIVRAEIDYRAEVRLSDRLGIETRITRTGRSSFTFGQRIVFPDGRVAAEASNVMVSTRDGKAVPVPEELRGRLLGGAGNEDGRPSGEGRPRT